MRAVSILTSQDFMCHRNWRVLGAATAPTSPPWYCALRACSCCLLRVQWCSCCLCTFNVVFFALIGVYVCALNGVFVVCLWCAICNSGPHLDSRSVGDVAVFDANVSMLGYHEVRLNYVLILSEYFVMSALSVGTDVPQSAYHLFVPNNVSLVAVGAVSLDGANWTSSATQGLAGLLPQVTARGARGIYIYIYCIYVYIYISGSLGSRSRLTFCPRPRPCRWARPPCMPTCASRCCSTPPRAASMCKHMISIVLRCGVVRVLAHPVPWLCD